LVIGDGQVELAVVVEICESGGNSVVAVGLLADPGFGADVGDGAVAGRVALRKLRDAGEGWPGVESEGSAYTPSVPAIRLVASGENE
jgi:hypothetical protein